MKKIMLVFLVLLPVLAFAGAWYVGGNLHQGNGNDWISATYNNRLATCADFVLAVTPDTQKRPLFDNQILFKRRAVALEACISETLKEPSARNMKNTEIATVCLALLGQI